MIIMITVSEVPEQGSEAGSQSTMYEDSELVLGACFHFYETDVIKPVAARVRPETPMHNKFSVFYEGSLSCSQKSSCGSYPEPFESIPHPHTLFL